MAGISDAVAQSIIAEHVINDQFGDEHGTAGAKGFRTLYNISLKMILSVPPLNSNLSPGKPPFGSVIEGQRAAKETIDSA